jgi:GNAT superfamily N-acetyltransferase
MDTNLMSYREAVRESDCESVRKIVRSTDCFSAEEIEIAVSLVCERLALGPASGYHFIFTELAGEVVGYTCYGRIPGTTHSYDLYWIAVADTHRGKGIGRLLLKETEVRAAFMGASKLYAETSSREQYSATRRFYTECGFKKEVVLKDFYAPGDSKVIYMKSLVTDGTKPFDNLRAS